MYRTQVTSKKASRRARIPLALFALYFILKPFYLFESGTPQIADLVVVVMCAVTALRGDFRLDRTAVGVAVAATLLAGYMTFVNGVWALILEDEDIVQKYMVFYVFNLGVLYATLQLHSMHGEDFLRWVIIGVLGSIALQTLLSPFVSTGGGRQILFFNNPNQLGYWSVLCGSLLFLLAPRLRIGIVVQLLAGAAVAYLSMLSLSKAAMISVAVMLAFAFLRRPSHALIAGLVVTVVALLAADSALFESVTGRLGNIGQQQDDNLAGRGYDRIWRWPEYLIFGAGEGALWRFHTKLEVHSTFGMLVFSYGIPGIGLFCLLVYRIVKQGGMPALFALVPSFLYGLTHQGMRQSMFWVLFALAAVVPERRPVRARVAKPGLRPQPGAESVAGVRHARQAHEAPPH
jgi:hypothetical protein